MSWDLLQYFPNEMVTVALFRGDLGSYVDGEWVPNLEALTNIEIIAPQPLTSNEAQLIDDGEHVRDYLRSWSKTKVYPRERDRDADRLSWNGDTYKVMQADNRVTLGGFYAFEMRRLEPGTI